MLVDSHAHIYLEQFDSDRQDVMERALEHDVQRILMPNIDHTSIDRMLETEESWPDMCRSMMGLHPCSVNKHFEKELYQVEEWLSRGGFIAVGEIGTDLYWDKTYFKEQKEAFRIQCQLAVEHDLPVVIHCRESMDETIELVEEFSDQGLRGVFHCFTGSKSHIDRITNLGFYFGIGGVLTFKNGGLFEVVDKIPMDHVLLETDSPYLAPTPNRGKRNEPSYVSLVAQKLEAATKVDINKITEITTNNCQHLFRI